MKTELAIVPLVTFRSGSRENKQSRDFHYEHSVQGATLGGGRGGEEKSKINCGRRS